MLLGLALLLLIAAVIILVQSCSKPTVPVSENFVLTDDLVLPKGVSIAQMDVGELTVGEARSRVLALLQPKLDAIAITLLNEHIDTDLHANDIGASYDVDAALSAAVQGKRNGIYEVDLLIDDEVLLESVYALNGNLSDHAENASFVINTDEDGKSEFAYTEGHAGMQLDHDGIIAEVHSVLDQGTLVHKMSPNVQISQPTVTAAQLKEKTTLLASYQTEYQYRRTSSTTDDELENMQARDHNITKALKMMNVIALEPGYNFSFNDTTGKRDEKNDWALANAVYKDGLRKETGGGVCQITTTMFNALLHANIRIVNRKGHGIPSTYVTKHFEEGLGFDATVDYPGIDFKFQNNTGETLYVFCYVYINPQYTRRKLVTIEVYGQAPEPGVTYKLRNEILEHIIADQPEQKLDKNQLVGYDVITRNPHDYYKVTTYVDKYIDGKFAETVRTETTEYQLIQEMHTIGTKPLPTPTPGPIVTPKPTPTDNEPDIPEL